MFGCKASDEVHLALRQCKRVKSLDQVIALWWCGRWALLPQTEEVKGHVMILQKVVQVRDAANFQGDIFWTK